MQNIVFANNIATTLAASLTSSQTTATLASSAGLPTLATGQIFPLTLNDAATQTIYEIVYVTAISGATLTIERGKEGTASRAWSVGDFAFSTNTAATTSDPYDVQGATYYTGTDIGTANTYAVTLSPVPLALTPGMEVSIQNIVGTNTGASTLNVNATGALPIYYPGNVALGANSLIATYNATFRLNNGGTAWTLINSTGADVGPTPAANDSSNKRATTQYVETQIQSGSPVFAVAGGTSDALTATLPAGLTALQNGMKVRLQLAAANTTTTPTLNVTIGSTATGALAIVKAANSALAVGDLIGASAEAEFTYNQTNNNWVLTNPPASLPAAVNLSGLVSDTTLAVNQLAYLDVSSATTAALHIATGDHQLYEIDFNFNGANVSASNILLNPNNSTYTSQFPNRIGSWSSTTVSPGSSRLNGLTVNAGGTINTIARISTATLSKSCAYFGDYNYSSDYDGTCGSSFWANATSGLVPDTTTAWTSLGTLVFPVAVTGRIWVKRIA